MRSTDDYLKLIPPLYAGKQNFVGTITATVAPFADLQSLFSGFPAAFDLDAAIGAQLDVDGQWIGQSRNIPIPIIASWFSWNISGRGWGQEPWQNPSIQQTYISSLDDATYRRLLYAKVIANYGDGQTDTAQLALNAYFVDPATFVFVEDISAAVGLINVFAWGTPGHGWSQSNWTNFIAQPSSYFSWNVYGDGWNETPWFAPSTRIASEEGDAGRLPFPYPEEAEPALPYVQMIWQVGVAGAIPSVTDLEILAQRLIPIAPAGVELDIYVVTVNNTPLFGWGMESDLVSGWGVGSWGAPPDFVAQYNPDAVQSAISPLEEPPAFGWGMDTSTVSGWGVGYWGGVYF